MCGVAGVVHLNAGMAPPSRERLARMAGAIEHRGPDAFGLYRDARVGLVHTRLAIVDLAGGAQPLGSDDGERHVIFNGEVFNFVELRHELEALGHVFRTRSDTEVVLRAFEQWGHGAFERFNGQWAIALWDARAQRLVLSRDRLGVRPLYLAEQGGRLLFASEVKSLFADPDVPRRVDPAALDDAFTFWAPLAPRSAFVGVGELPPGHTLTLDLRTGERELAAYWQPSYPDEAARAASRTGRAPSVEEAARALRDKLEAATRLRVVRADVPVGAYLSGGLDSSIIAALGRSAAHGAFKTFALRFADAEFDETVYQRAMAERLGSEHAEVVVSRDDIARVFPEVIYHAERPMLRTAPAPLFILSRLVRDAGIKVVLTGEGADEMLAGYDLFREAKVRRFWAKNPASTLRPRLFDRLYPYLARSPARARGMSLAFWARGLDRPDAPEFSHAPRWQSAAALKRLFGPHTREALLGRDAVGELLATLPPEFAGWEPLARAQYLEVRTLLSAYLLSSQGDRMLMANSVEGRFPFLDRDVVAFANALPARYKLAGLDEKHVLKRAAQDIVPEQILRRPKQPYRAPDALAFVAGAGGVPEYVAELFSERSLADAGLFDPGAANALFRKCAARGAEVAASGETAGAFSNADNMAFVGVLSSQLLHEQLVRRPVSVPGNVAFATCIDRMDGPTR